MSQDMRQTGTLRSVLNGQDIVVLLKLAGPDQDWTVRSLEAELGIPRAGVHRSLQRLSAAGLYDLERRRPNLSQAEEFLVHAVKYLFPPEMNGETRGVPTAWAAPPLADQLAPLSDLPPVWPDPQGRQRGMGDARVRGLATKLLAQRLARPAATA